ncbi:MULTISPECIES: class I SAM-dependent methyltransferase [Streptomyces]|uniref:class I SAM-dependent methyltransferase n=1 Tax=Streptomyces TaxID=1883 RepID=UPI00345C1276
MTEALHDHTNFPATPFPGRCVPDPQAAAARLADLAGDGAALEIGVGGGDTAFALADWGVPVFGIDASPEKIERLAERQPKNPETRLTVHTRHADLAHFDLGTRYPLVYAVAGAVFELASQDDQVGCFRSAARHLTAQGSFVVEAPVPSAWGIPSGQPQMMVSEIGEQHLAWSALVHEPVGQTVRTQEVRVGPDGYRARPGRLRYAHPSELDLMAQLAGLQLEERWADWAGTPVTASSTRHVSVYRPLPETGPKAGARA